MKITSQKRQRLKSLIHSEGAKFVVRVADDGDWRIWGGERDCKFECRSGRWADEEDLLTHLAKLKTRDTAASHLEIISKGVLDQNRRGVRHLASH